MDYELELPEEFEGMELLQTLISPANSDMGIMILGENYAEGAEWPTVRIYLISIGKDEWDLEGELQAFTFPSFGSAKRFVEDLPSMSAIDLLLLMNGHKGTHTNKNMLQ